MTDKDNRNSSVTLSLQLNVSIGNKPYQRKIHHMISHQITTVKPNAIIKLPFISFAVYISRTTLTFFFIIYCNNQNNEEMHTNICNVTKK